METILLLTHTEADGTLGKPALETVNAARTLAQELNWNLISGIIGETIQHAASQLSSCGANRILAVAGSDFKESRYATDAAALEALCQAGQPSLVVAPATSRFMRVMAGVSRRMNGRIDTHATSLTAIDGAPAITRWYYRQRIEAVLQRTQRPWFITLDSGCYEPYLGTPGNPTVETLALELSDSLKRTKVAGFRAPLADEQTIRPEAKLLFVAGAGWTKTQSDGKSHAGDAQRIILDFLRLSQASLGGSKSLVDLSGEGQTVLPFMTHLNQVGQTGSTPRHPKGLSTCCHGEEPHVVGWRFINERRAINLDPRCGWSRGKADVVYVANAFEVIERVSALLAQRNK